MEKVKVVAAAVDMTELTLYLVNGETIRIPQGDPRVKKIIEYVTPIVTAGGIAEVDLSAENTYKQFEEKTNGLVKFFKVAKSKLSSFFKAQKAEAVSEMVVGKLPIKTDTFAEVKETNAQAIQKTEKLTSALNEIMENAKPVHSAETVSSSETVIAVVNNKVVPDVEQIQHQIANSISTGTKGLQRFMERVAAVASKRSHSAQDLMKFLQRGDLPIADDGSIVIYKVLRRKDDRYVDCHTGLVKQRVGSYVCMDESMVDHNRRNECSNGLHVARRAYVGGFSGDVCVIAKVNPEDVIAVPEYDANKMRVCGYHILFELSDEDFQKLKRNAPITDTEAGRILLGRALSGDHPEPIEDVRIGGHKGTNVSTTPRKKTSAPVVEVKPAVALDPDKQNFIPEAVVNPVDVERAVVQNKFAPEEAQKAPEEEKTVPLVPEVPETKTEPQKPDVTPVATAIQAVATSKGIKMAKTTVEPAAKKLSPRQQIRALLDKKILNKEQAMAVFAIKKAAKKNWQALGVSKEEQKSVDKYLSK